MFTGNESELKKRIDELEAQLQSRDELLRLIRPMAAWESCMYTNRYNDYQRSLGRNPKFSDDDVEINSMTHCCDWNEIVERIDNWFKGSDNGTSAKVHEESQ